MTVYNVLVAVVELIDAESETEAIEALKARLRDAGFEPYDGQPASAFESEPT